MSKSKGWRPRPGCWGCGGFVFVLIVGGILSIFGVAFSIGASVGIPLTHSNATVAGSIGSKTKAVDVLPSYLHGRVAGDQNFVNNSTTLTIGPAEGAGLIVVGHQDGAPAVDLYLTLR